LATALSRGAFTRAIGLFHITLKVGIPGAQGTYKGRSEIVEPVQDQSFKLKLEGRGAGGFLKGEGVLSCEDSPEGTLIRYFGEAQVGGLFASVGQRLVEGAARQIISQFFQSFAKSVGDAR
jgi:uncharacterized protein